MEEKILRSPHHGKLKIGDTELNCAVLEDGTRIISKSAIFKAFKRTKRGRAKNENREPNMPAFIDAKNVKRFISNDLLEVLKPVKYITWNGKLSEGYKAEILPLLCDVYLRARDAEKLLPQQAGLAKMAEILVRSFAKIGIVALIDEATGYQDIRKRNELQEILKAYISEELLPWTKRFPDEFYKEMFRLKSWPYDPKSVKRPSLIGRLTNKLIYKQLPPGVLQELKNKTPKSEKGNYTARFHQSLTEDIGHPNLKGQLQQVIVLMRISPNWNVFERNFVRAFGGQQKLDLFKEDDK
ncbi:MAG: P63C domain-containing protein [Patescibacteria group bacterium]|jgi:hypothetical protein